MATVYEGPDCTLRSRALKESDFLDGRHADGWDACYGTWDDGSAIATIHSFEVHPGFEVNTSAQCHDTSYFQSKLIEHSHVKAGSCVPTTYDLKYVEYNSSNPGPCPVPFGSPAPQLRALRARGRWAGGN